MLLVGLEYGHHQPREWLQQISPQVSLGLETPSLYHLPCVRIYVSDELEQPHAPDFFCYVWPQRLACGE
jgi:hypothetical protein